MPPQTGEAVAELAEERIAAPLGLTCARAAKTVCGGTP
ncbi:CubicO group peptidase (beta-lactamase class C family) [Parvularcula dongshanensis]|uniref:CubicO group peptidase (Beta-lactamase class C family) n=1 Tax=Parvularcula dongshanensis TaxID=1173995 RepID=A0A840I2Z8_9PROT|nr:CubicO group peptidase (beta-lactamase class C family) [Parvularcula dongshanensis]